MKRSLPAPAACAVAILLFLLGSVATPARAQIGIEDLLTIEMTD